jgi:tetratricopeptide (TPR) repeat protein
MVGNITSHQALALSCCALLPLAAGCGLRAQGHNVSGVQYYQQGNYPVALARFQEAQRANPQNPDSYYNQAALLHQRGLQTRNTVDLQQAEAMYNTCLGYDPNHVDCHRGLAVLLTETGRTREAFALLSKWAGNNPQSADAQVELARLSEEVGDNRNAEAYLTEALRRDLKNWRAHAALGRQRELAGRYAEAKENYERAYAYNPTQTQLASKVQEMNMKLASSSLPGNNTSAAAGGVSGYNWTNPVGNSSGNIIASPARSPLGTTSASAPNANIRY